MHCLITHGSTIRGRLLPIIQLAIMACALQIDCLCFRKWPCLHSMVRLMASFTVCIASLLGAPVQLIFFPVLFLCLVAKGATFT
jgi:hypothetical protein